MWSTTLVFIVDDVFTLVLVSVLADCGVQCKLSYRCLIRPTAFLCFKTQLVLPRSGRINLFVSNALLSRVATHRQHWLHSYCVLQSACKLRSWSWFWLSCSGSRFDRGNILVFQPGKDQCKRGCVFYSTQPFQWL